MKQSRATSLIKSIVSTAVGFAVALAANAVVLPFFGYTPTFKENLLLTTIYTVISIARGYGLERFYEALGWRTRMSAFALAVLAERQRQIHGEGWTTEHDDDHAVGELARAGAAYVIHAPTHAGLSAGKSIFGMAIAVWPWEREWWKPQDFRRDLVKGAALILAEGERFDRTRKRKPAVTDDRPRPLSASLDTKTAAP